MTLPTLTVAHEVRAIAQDEPQERTCGCRCRQCSAFIHDQRDCFHPRQDPPQDTTDNPQED
jgi:hypothetical protein